jgi:hypothetical protein
MRLGAGDRERAQQHLDDWVGHCLARVSSEPYLWGHLDYLTDFASRVGLKMPRADGPM